MTKVVDPKKDFRGLTQEEITALSDYERKLQQGEKPKEKGDRAKARDVAKGMFNAVGNLTNRVLASWVWAYKKMTSDQLGRNTDLNEALALKNQYDNLEKINYFSLDDTGKKAYRQQLQAIDDAAKLLSQNAKTYDREKFFEAVGSYGNSAPVKAMQNAAQEPEDITRIREKITERDFRNWVHNLVWDGTQFVHDSKANKVVEINNKELADKLYQQSFSRPFEPHLRAVVAFQDKKDQGYELTPEEQQVFDWAKRKIEGSKLFLADVTKDINNYNIEPEKWIYNRTKKNPNYRDIFSAETSLSALGVRENNETQYSRVLANIDYKLAKERGSYFTQGMSYLENKFAYLDRYEDALWQVAAWLSKGTSNILSVIKGEDDFAYDAESYKGQNLLYDNTVALEAYKRITGSESRWDDARATAMDKWFNIIWFLLENMATAWAISYSKYLARSSKLWKGLVAMKGLFKPKVIKALAMGEEWAYQLLSKTDEVKNLPYYLKKIWGKILQETAENVQAQAMIGGRYLDDYNSNDLAMDVLSSALFVWFALKPLKVEAKIAAANAKMAFVTQAAKSYFAIPDFTRRAMSHSDKEVVSTQMLKMMDASKPLIQNSEFLSALRNKYIEVKKWAVYDIKTAAEKANAMNRALDNWLTNTKEGQAFLVQNNIPTDTKKISNTLSDKMREKAIDAVYEAGRKANQKSTYTRVAMEAFKSEKQFIKKFNAARDAVNQKKKEDQEIRMESFLTSLTPVQKVYWDEWTKAYNIPEAKNYSQLKSQIREFQKFFHRINTTRNEQIRITKETMAEKLKNKYTGILDKMRAEIPKNIQVFNFQKVGYWVASVRNHQLQLNWKGYFNFINSLDIPDHHKAIILSHHDADGKRVGNHYTTNEYGYISKPYSNPFEQLYFLWDKGVIKSWDAEFLYKVDSSDGKTIIDIYTKNKQTGDETNIWEYSLDEKSGNLVLGYIRSDYKKYFSNTELDIIPTARTVPEFKTTEESIDFSVPSVRQDLAELVVEQSGYSAAITRFPQIRSIPQKLWRSIINSNLTPIQKYNKIKKYLSSNIADIQWSWPDSFAVKVKNVVDLQGVFPDGEFVISAFWKKGSLSLVRWYGEDGKLIVDHYQYKETPEGYSLYKYNSEGKPETNPSWTIKFNDEGEFELSTDGTPFRWELKVWKNKEVMPDKITWYSVEYNLKEIDEALGYKGLWPTTRAEILNLPHNPSSAREYLAMVWTNFAKKFNLRPPHTPQEVLAVLSNYHHNKQTRERAKAIDDTFKTGMHLSDIALFLQALQNKKTRARLKRLAKQSGLEIKNELDAFMLYHWRKTGWIPTSKTIAENQPRHMKRKYRKMYSADPKRFEEYEKLKSEYKKLKSKPQTPEQAERVIELQWLLSEREAVMNHVWKRIASIRNPNPNTLFNLVTSAETFYPWALRLFGYVDDIAAYKKATDTTNIVKELKSKIKTLNSKIKKLSNPNKSWRTRTTQQAKLQEAEKELTRLKSELSFYWDWKYNDFLLTKENMRFLNNNKKKAEALMKDEGNSVINKVVEEYDNEVNTVLEKADEEIPNQELETLDSVWEVIDVNESYEKVIEDWHVYDLSNGAYSSRWSSILPEKVVEVIDQEVKQEYPNVWKKTKLGEYEDWKAFQDKIPLRWFGRDIDETLSYSKLDDFEVPLKDGKVDTDVVDLYNQSILEDTYTPAELEDFKKYDTEQTTLVLAMNDILYKHNFDPALIWTALKFMEEGGFKIIRKSLPPEFNAEELLYALSEYHKTKFWPVFTDGNQVGVYFKERGTQSVDDVLWEVFKTADLLKIFGGIPNEKYALHSLGFYNNWGVFKENVHWYDSTEWDRIKQQVQTISESLEPTLWAELMERFAILEDRIARFKKVIKSWTYLSDSKLKTIYNGARSPLEYAPKKLISTAILLRDLVFVDNVNYGTLKDRDEFMLSEWFKPVSIDPNIDTIFNKRGRFYMFEGKPWARQQARKYWLKNNKQGPLADYYYSVTDTHFSHDDFETWTDDDLRELIREFVRKQKGLDELDDLDETTDWEEDLDVQLDDDAKIEVEPQQKAPDNPIKNTVFNPKLTYEERVKRSRLAPPQKPTLLMWEEEITLMDEANKIALLIEWMQKGVEMPWASSYARIAFENNAKDRGGYLMNLITYYLSHLGSVWFGAKNTKLNGTQTKVILPKTSGSPDFDIHFADTLKKLLEANEARLGHKTDLSNILWNAGDIYFWTKVSSWPTPEGLKERLNYIYGVLTKDPATYTETDKVIIDTLTNSDSAKRLSNRSSAAKSFISTVNDLLGYKSKVKINIKKSKKSLDIWKEIIIIRNNEKVNPEVITLPKEWFTRDQLVEMYKLWYEPYPFRSNTAYKMVLSEHWVPFIKMSPERIAVNILSNIDEVTTAVKSGVEKTPEAIYKGLKSLSNDVPLPKLSMENAQIEYKDTVWSPQRTISLSPEGNVNLIDKLFYSLASEAKSWEVIELTWPFREEWAWVLNQLWYEPVKWKEGATLMQLKDNTVVEEIQAAHKEKLDLEEKANESSTYWFCDI